uniref:Uncharacterized protein n=1 Tax=Oryctolagus cuniculus TaxID=9986 RepID=A0A5F9DR49_RABIT
GLPSTAAAKLNIDVDFTPKGTGGVFHRDHCLYYNKDINVKKGSIVGLYVLLAAYMLFSDCFLTKNSNMSELHRERRDRERERSSIRWLTPN